MTALKLTRSGRKVKCHAADLGGNAGSTERRASMAQIHLQLKGKTCSECSHFWERSILLSTELIVTRLARMHFFCNRASEVTLHTCARLRKWPYIARCWFNLLHPFPARSKKTKGQIPMLNLFTSGHIFLTPWLHDIWRCEIIIWATEHRTSRNYSIEWHKGWADWSCRGLFQNQKGPARQQLWSLFLFSMSCIFWVLLVYVPLLSIALTNQKGPLPASCSLTCT